MRLRNLALMLLRVLIVASLALAAARPLGRTGGSGHAPAAIGIVLDNSLSSGQSIRAGPRSKRCSRVPQQILDAATPADRIWLLTVDGEISAGDVATARDALDRVRPIGGAGDLVGAIERAVAVTQSSGMNASTVVVLTDGQAHNGRAPHVSAPCRSPSLRLATSRRRIARCAKRARSPVRWVPRGALEVAIASTDSSDVRVALGERTLARTTLGPAGAITVRGAAEKEGWQSGRVEIAPDEMRGDDVRYFAVFAGRAPAVRVDASAGAFARGAVETLADGGRVDLGGRSTSRGQNRPMKRPVLAFAPVDPIRVGAANRALVAAGIPWKFGEAIRDETSVHGGELDGTSGAHSVPAHTEWRRGSRYARDCRRRAVGCCGRGLCVRWVSTRSICHESCRVGAASSVDESVIARYLLADGGRVVSTSPLLPSRCRSVSMNRRCGSSTIRCAGRTVRAPGRTGVYWMRRAGSVVGALVVNPEPAESDLAPLDSAGLASHVAGNSRVVIRPGIPSHARCFRPRRGDLYRHIAHRPRCASLWKHWSPAKLPSQRGAPLKCHFRFWLTRSPGVGRSRGWPMCCRTRENDAPSAAFTDLPMPCCSRDGARTSDAILRRRCRWRGRFSSARHPTRGC